jgi:outer membrane receptor protein involved in Fe transport
MFALLLLAAQVQDTITVTATRTETRLSDTPASVVVLPKEAIAASAATTVDNALREVPGFTLFRRSDSRTANPTSQGVSLRGIGASGASRALVLDDGIPLNDPFGGWIYWGRVARASLDRIEVVRGGGSELYGSAAMGGVVQFIRRPTSSDALVVDAGGGSERTAVTSLFAATQRHAWSGSVSGDFLTSAGYILVQPSQRGAVDTPANSHHTAFDATVERAFGDSARAFLRASRYDERRENGTPLQTNDTAIRQLAAGADLGGLDARVYVTHQDYAQSFSAIATDRNSERLTVLQKVPSRGEGASVQWGGSLFTRHALLAGGELRAVRGESDEEQFTARGTSFVSSGGRQRTESAFAEDLISVSSKVTVTTGLRYDQWNGRSAWSPRLAVLVHATDRLALTASAYRAFRAPTLNELYRSFRVGNILTLANASLGAERLNAIEAGARFGNVRVTAFSMTTEDAIANVTQSVTPSLITRQRQNLGSSRSRGFEVDGDWHLGVPWQLSAGYLLSDATVTAGDLRGKRLPQVPRNSATAQLAYTPSRVTFGLQTRWSGRQFDDDLNTLPLRSYFAADVFTSVPLIPLLSATIAIENALDRRIETSATPVITLANPRTIRFGLRYTR